MSHQGLINHSIRQSYSDETVPLNSNKSKVTPINRAISQNLPSYYSAARLIPSLCNIEWWVFYFPLPPPSCHFYLTDLPSSLPTPLLPHPSSILPCPHSLLTLPQPLLPCPTPLLPCPLPLCPAQFDFLPIKLYFLLTHLFFFCVSTSPQLLPYDRQQIRMILTTLLGTNDAFIVYPKDSSTGCICTVCFPYWVSYTIPMIAV